MIFAPNLKAIQNVSQSVTLGYNILWGHRPDKLYHSYMVMGTEIVDKRIGALIKGQHCFVRVDAFNENGITVSRTIPL